MDVSTSRTVDFAVEVILVEPLIVARFDVSVSQVVANDVAMEHPEAV